MKRSSIVTLIPFVLLAACGGSDTSYLGANNPPDPDPTGFAITPDNGLQVAQVAYQSVVTSGDIAGLAGSNGLTASAGGGFTKPTSNTQIGGLPGFVIQSVPLPPETYQCIPSGSVTYTFDIDLNAAAVGMLAAGDTILIEYDMCNEGLGEVIDGTIDSIVDAFDGSILTSLYDMTMTMQLVAFSVTSATDTLIANGDGTATLNTMAAPYVEASVSGDSMTTDTNSTSETLTNYSSVQTVDAGLSPAPYTMIASGTLNSSELSGAVTYTTEDMFEGTDTNYPHAGRLLVASDASSVSLTALINGVDVQIDFYSNATGTGEPDQTIMTTWAELAAL